MANDYCFVVIPDWCTGPARINTRMALKFGRYAWATEGGSYGSSTVASVALSELLAALKDEPLYGRRFFVLCP
jgi:hypothetical protein